MFQAMQGAKAFWKISGGEIWKSWEHLIWKPPLNSNGLSLISSIWYLDIYTWFRPTPCVSNLDDRIRLMNCRKHMVWDIGRLAQIQKNIQISHHCQHYHPCSLFFHPPWLSNLFRIGGFVLWCSTLRPYLGGAWEVRQSLRLVCQRGGVLRKEGPTCTWVSRIVSRQNDGCWFGVTDWCMMFMMQYLAIDLKNLLVSVVYICLHVSIAAYGCCFSSKDGHVWGIDP